jgi:hypothetical protein
MSPADKQQQVLIATRNRVRYVYSLVNRDFLQIDVPVTRTNYKIAVVFSGGLRNFDVTMEWANKFLINPLKANVFFHGWCNKNGVDNNIQAIQGYPNLKKFKILEREKNPIPIPEVMKTRYPDHVRRGLGMELAEHVLGQLFNIRNSFDLLKEYEKESGISYDIVIRARPDVFWYAHIPDQDLDHVMQNKCIATPQHYISIICGNHHINDQFAMAQTAIMEQYTRMFDKIPEYSGISPDDSATEFFVTHHIRNVMKMPIYNIDATFMLDYPSDYPIERGFNHSTLRHKDQNDSEVAKMVTENIIRSR